MNLPSRQFQPKRCVPSLLGASQYAARPRGFVSLALARFTLVEVPKTLLLCGVGFKKPFDIAVCQGRIYVSDSVSRTIMSYDVPSKNFYEIGQQDPGALLMPLGVATDRDCNVFVADATAKTINRYDKDGKFLKARF